MKSFTVELQWREAEAMEGRRREINQGTSILLLTITGKNRYSLKIDRARKRQRRKGRRERKRNHGAFCFL